MSDTTVHLKLDRLLAGQDRIIAGQTEQDATTRALIAGVENLAAGLDANRELLTQLAEAMSAEEGGEELRDLVLSITQHLEQIEADGGQVVALLTDLTPALERAAHDGVRLAMGDGIDIPPSGNGQ